MIGVSADAVGGHLVPTDPDLAARVTPDFARIPPDRAGSRPHEGSDLAMFRLREGPDLAAGIPPDLAARVTPDPGR